ncbi:Ceramide glucosyltransferase [Conoideocrella luteorostrata]|uniref:Ceramide glucosyltransferase n=1 Tax=Conoideocrella luteorostrata TaxID=1105319 RepID=A0AAJ0CP14_9HYPO|nr:Ceramide glucosyltransferase [Conoideocrella luteorostrata]
MGPFVETLAVICLVWSVAVVVVQGIGIAAIFRFFSKPAPPPVSSKLGQDTPTVTVIRPVKGLEPRLYECIASTFRQDYPIDKLSIRLCVEDETDPAYPVLQKLIHDFPHHDAQVLVESQDPILHGTKGHVDNLGPNPKIRNISRAYREAKGEIVWIIDCNVWVSSGVLGRMVDKLMGFAPAGKSAKPYKFVHQMPLVVDIVDYNRPGVEDSQVLLSSATETEGIPGITKDSGEDLLTRICRHGGGRLDEMFFATTHVKFYGAINSVSIAPCIVGKSNMFRKAHLDQVTDPSSNPIIPKGENKRSGVDYFSFNICEDHLIGDLLWRSNIPGYLNHGIVWGDLVVQPMSSMSIASYVARRCRWLRARKFTVLAATLVEPGVESLLCCAYFAFALTTLPWFHDKLGIPQSWSSMGLIWLVAVTAWMFLDWRTFKHLHSGGSVRVNHDSPQFVRGTANTDGMPRRRFFEWFLAWVGREVLALPVWTWAVLCGTTITWRGKTFRVDLDASVVEIEEGSSTRNCSRTPELERARQFSKDRLD